MPNPLALLISSQIYPSYPAATTLTQTVTISHWGPASRQPDLRPYWAKRYRTLALYGILIFLNTTFKKVKRQVKIF